LYEIELDRISEIKGNIIADGAIFPILIERGLRAQLKSGNIVTGQLVVNLDFHPGSPAKYFGEGGIFSEIPTVPSTFDELTSSITDLIAKIKNLPLDKIAKGLEKTLTNANRVIKSADEIINTSEAKNLVRNLDTSIKRFNSIASKVDIDMMPRLTAVIQEANETLATVKDAVSENSPLRYNLENTLEELSKAARSVRGLAEYLERNPNALISGKKAN
jgi:paraquat-inducible protein B